MIPDVPIAIYILSGSGLLLTAAFAFPALTSGGGTSMPGVLESAYEAAHQTELDYCRGAARDMNCACFAHTSGMIIAYGSGTRRVWGHLDQTTLGRAQASARC